MIDPEIVAVRLLTLISDTSSSILTHLLTHLAHSPHDLALLQSELASVPLTSTSDDGSVQDAHLKNLPHLDALILETLRMHPPVPSALPRSTPAEGLVIGAEAVGLEASPLVLPPETVVWTPQYVIGRSTFFTTNARFLRAPTKGYLFSSKPFVLHC